MHRRLFRIFVIGVLVLFIFPTSGFADVWVRSFSDGNFGTYTGGGNKSLSDNLCVYNSDTENYYVTGTGNHGSFIVKAGSEELDFHAYYNDEEGTTGNVEIFHNTQSALQSGADTSSTSCGGGANMNANVQVVFFAADMAAAEGGVYTGTLSIMVEPE